MKWGPNQSGAFGGELIAESTGVALQMVDQEARDLPAIMPLYWWQLDGRESCLIVAGGQLSSRLLSARSANALLELPAAEGIIPQAWPPAFIAHGVEKLRRWPLAASESFCSAAEELFALPASNAR